MREERGAAANAAAMPPSKNTVIRDPTSVSDKGNVSSAKVGQKVITAENAKAAPDGAAASIQRNLYVLRTLMGDWS